MAKSFLISIPYKGVAEDLVARVTIASLKLTLLCFGLDLLYGDVVMSVELLRSKFGGYYMFLVGFVIVCHVFIRLLSFVY